ncbi:sigma 54-interacting transcriptional regulator, partial [bacterium]|nr:sigma 54-interacting transcriptional regulator [candidate division CSSED10-310 bacterium]
MKKQAREVRVNRSSTESAGRSVPKAVTRPVAGDNAGGWESVILDSVNEGVFTVDNMWQITAFNAAAERITQIDRRDAVGSRCSDVFRADICEKDCPLRRTMATGQPIIHAMAHIVNMNGDSIPIRISTALLRDPAGRIIGGVETFQDLTIVEQLRREIEGRYTFEDIIGRSPAMQALFELVPLVADSDSTVLLEGPSGTGKELFARAIHNLSERRSSPFVAVNCAALPDTLL